MFIIAVAFITSTAGLLVAPVVEAVRRELQRRFGRRA